MKKEIVEMLRQAIEEIESGRARGCFMACFGENKEDQFSVSGCEPEIRDTVIAVAEEMLADIKGHAGHPARMQ